MRLDIRHQTIYRYATPVRYSIQYLRLTPRDEAGQRILHWRIDAPGRMWRQVDGYGNVVHVASCEEPQEELRIIVTGAIETTLAPGMPLAHELPLPPSAFLVSTPLTAPDEALQRLTHAVPPSTDVRDTIDRLMAVVRNEVAYEQGWTDVEHSAGQALALRRGVCQDLAHILLACARLRGYPARYVSGYIDAGDAGHIASHAWVDVWIENEGWVSYDPTHGAFANERYCRLAVGRDYLDASPVRGMRRGGTSERMEVAVQVSPGAAQQ